MKVSLLVHDLSDNNLVSVYTIGKVLERNHEVEVIGPNFGEEIFGPYKDEFEYKEIDMSYFPLGLKGLRAINDAIGGDVVYAFNPLLTNFGSALISKKINETPVVLDFRDRIGYGFSDKSLFRKLVSLGGIYHPIKSSLLTYWVSNQYKSADKVTVASKNLQQLYGGTFLPQGVDCSFFNPENFEKENLRDKKGIDKDVKIVLFAGTPRPHKGVDTLLQGIKNCGEDVKALIIGKETEYLERMRENYDFIYDGIRPHEEMPEYLALSDFVVLPQKKENAGEYQVPAKIYEAMAMEVPVIASKVSDMPEILEECGRIIEKSDPDLIAEALDELSKDPRLCNELGRKSRSKCKKNYSWDAMEDILEDILEDVS